MNAKKAKADLEVTMRPLSQLLPYANNARMHSDEQIAVIARSIAEFGFINPVLMDDNGTIVAGHGRVLAAAKLGLQQVPAIAISHLTPAQIRAYRLMDNSSALLSTWDNDLLKVELADLKLLDFDLDLTGFTNVDLEALLYSNDGLAPEDDAPPVPVKPASRVGDLWVLGRHWLLCGDATKADDVKVVLRGVAPHLMVTDPPYGVEYDPNWRNERARTSVGMGNRALGAGAVGKVSNDNRADWHEAWALFPGDVAYVWCASLHSPVVADGLIAVNFELRSLVIWDKTRLIIGRSDYHWQHEPCWYAVRKGKTGHWAGDRKQTTIWSITHQKSETGHGTQKPVECMKRPIENNSLPGQAVYDPFVGSGTTIIAAEMTGRCCHAIELDPTYVDVTVQRWQNFTGLDAVLDGSGQTFSQVSADRLNVEKTQPSQQGAVA